MSGELQYRRVNWKYVLEKEVQLALPLELCGDVYISPYLIAGGSLLVIKDGYAWDGASGPTVDTPATMYPALVHDALYQLMRLGIIPTGARKEADKLFLKIVEGGRHAILPPLVLLSGRALVWGCVREARMTKTDKLFYASLVVIFLSVVAAWGLRLC